MGDEAGKTLCGKETDDCYGGGIVDGKSEGLDSTVVLFGSPIVADNGLHTLRETEHDHDQQADDAVDNAEGANGQIAAIMS